MGRIGYCSACDRNVPVILRTPAEVGRTPAPGDAEALVCLDYGVRCTGALCPLFSVDSASSVLPPPAVGPESSPGADAPSETTEPLAQA